MVANTSGTIHRRRCVCCMPLKDEQGAAFIAGRSQGDPETEPPRLSAGECWLVSAVGLAIGCTA